VSDDLKIKGGADGDTVNILASAMIQDSASISLGDGANSLTVDGTIQNDLKYSGGDGNDMVLVNAAASIGDDVLSDDVSIRLSGGTNTVTVDGTINGDLSVVSTNDPLADPPPVGTDTVTINGTVAGVFTDGLGTQTNKRFRGGHHGHRHGGRGRC
jgi:hypothetical protein